MSRIILDTNIWRYITDSKQVFQLIKLASDCNIKIIMPPSIPLEISRFGNKSLRDEMLKHVCRDNWVRLMPEAYSQSMELRKSIQLLKPEWINNNCDTREFDATVGDWKRTKNGFWQVISTRPEFYININKDREDLILELSRSEIEKQRENVVDSKIRFENYDLNILKGEIQGTDYKGIDLWRLDGEDFSWNQIFIFPQNPYKDWLDTFLLKQHIRRSHWRDFWYNQITAEMVPRWWISWAFQFCATTRKISSGTPCDIQLSSYLQDCDYVVSADKIFIEIVNWCRQYAPNMIAHGKRVSAISTLNEIHEYFLSLKNS